MARMRGCTVIVLVGIAAAFPEKHPIGKFADATISSIFQGVFFRPDENADGLYNVLQLSEQQERANMAEEIRLDLLNVTLNQPANNSYALWHSGELLSLERSATFRVSQSARSCARASL